MEPQMACSSTVDNGMCWIFWAIGMGRDSLWEGNLLRWLPNTFSLLGLY